MPACRSCASEAAPELQFCPNCGATLADPLIGALLGDRYRIEALLGVGGMGVVYRALHTTLKREVAVKVLLQDLGGKDEFVRRFEREAESASRLAHPNIIAVTDFGRTSDGQLFLVMEYLAGPSLSAVIRSGPLPTARALAIVRQVLAGLAHAHAAGVVHRDLKPDNIMLLDRDGNADLVKILDFGIAKITDPGGGREALTQAGVIFGTPEYLSPEQALGEPVDARADLYAAGVILFEMLTGRRPFEAEDKIRIISMHLSHPAPRPSAVNPDVHVPPAIEDVVMQALQKQREHRFASAAAFATALEDAEQLSIGSQSPLATPRAPLAGGAARSPSITPMSPHTRSPSSTSDPSSSPGEAATALGVAATVASSTAAAPRIITPNTPNSTAATNATSASSATTTVPSLPSPHARVAWRAHRGPLFGAAAVVAVVAVVVGVVVARRPASSTAVATAPVTRPAPPPAELAAQIRVIEGLLASGEITKARVALDQTLADNPRNARVRYLLGRLAFADDRHGEALTDYREAIALDGGFRGDPILLQHLGVAVGETRLADDALDLAIQRVGKPAVDLLEHVANGNGELRRRQRAAAALAELGEGDRVDTVALRIAELKRAATCEERKPIVVALGKAEDTRALPALRAQRSRGGIESLFGADPNNACLKSELAEAIAKLEAKLPPEKRPRARAPTRHGPARTSSLFRGSR